jgi:hypothetical protein
MTDTREPAEIFTAKQLQTIVGKRGPLFDVEQRPINANCVALVDKLRVPLGLDKPFIGPLQKPAYTVVYHPIAWTGAEIEAAQAAGPDLVAERRAAIEGEIARREAILAQLIPQDREHSGLRSGE